MLFQLFQRENPYDVSKVQLPEKLILRGTAQDHLVFIASYLFTAVCSNPRTV